jgi:hypothetical protein
VQVIKEGGPVAWPAGSPDLILDFFVQLYDYKVYDTGRLETRQVLL